VEEEAEPSEAPDARPTQTAASSSPENRLQARSIVVGGVIALVSAAVGVGGALWSTHLSNSALDRRAQHDFLNTQRVTVFTRFIGDESAATSSESAVNASLLVQYQFGRPVYTGPPLSSLTQGLETLQTDAAAIRLVADDTAYAAARQVIDDHQQIFEYLIAFVNCGTRPKSGGEKAQSCTEDRQYGATLSDLSERMDRFVAIGKQEIE
jgi:hypothetical protein